MAALLVKLLVTPLLVAAASLAARRWGSQVAGWLAGFPFTSAPVAVILTIEHGPRFTAAAATATILGVLSQAGFAAAYILAARRTPWPLCLAAGSAAFAAATLLFAGLRLPAPAAALLAAAGLTTALLLTPRPGRTVAGVAPPRWDLPARMVVATGFVLLITGVASRVGPTLTGLLTPFPVYASVLGIFAHRQEGAAAGAAVMRGLLVGLYGFAAFFLVLAVLIVRSPPAFAFAAAAAAVFTVQFATLAAGRQASR